jgi:hypothetical protein
VVTQVESGVVAIKDLTPEQSERLRAAVRILIEYLLEKASFNNNEDETQAEANTVPSFEPQLMQLCLDLS